MDFFLLLANSTLSIETNIDRQGRIEMRSQSIDAEVVSSRSDDSLVVVHKLCISVHSARGRSGYAMHYIADRSKNSFWGVEQIDVCPLHGPIDRLQNI
jgi:hypothetical protein